MSQESSVTGTLAAAISPSVRYFRAGGFSQIYLDTAEDIEALATLDQTLWVASSCPTKGLDMDEQTLNLMDTDKDGRIRVPEILAAVKWTLGALKEPASLPEGRDYLDLEQINGDDANGAKILEAAKRILRNVDRHDATRITLADAMDRASIFAVSKSNGDGIIPVSAADGPTVGQVIQDILTTVGGETDQSGEIGVTSEGVEEFYNALQAYADWWLPAHPAARKQLDPEVTDDLPGMDATIFPLGENTAAAWAAVDAIADKVEDFFESCEVAGFDAQAVSFLNFSERDLLQLGGRTKAELDEMLKNLPLATVEADATLPLDEGVNPYYATALADLNRHVLEPILGQAQASLSRPQWLLARQKLAAYGAWLAAKQGASIEKLGLGRIFELLQDNKRAALEVLITLDKAIAEEIEAVDEVEKLLRYHRDLFRLLNNYVALPEFYDTKKRAIFQLGKLIIDGCALKLCVEVEDMAKHALIAEKSGIFIVYCEISRQGEPKNRMIAAAVTQRYAGRITAGKNAVFYDRYGKDWEARVVKIVMNPISLREAALAPFRKIAEVVGTQVDKLTSSRQKAIENSLSSSIQQVDKGVGAPPDLGKAPAPAADKGGMGAMGIGGMLAGGGVAMAALSSSFAYLAQTLSKINDLYLLYTLIVVLLFILLPAVIIGFFKLRARDIGMVLEACGWAINGKMRINLAMAKQLTHVGKFPVTSRRAYPHYAQKRGGIWRNLAWVLFISAAITGAVFLARELWFDKPADQPRAKVQSVSDSFNDAASAIKDVAKDAAE